MSYHRSILAFVLAAAIAAPLALRADDTHVKGPGPAHITGGEKVDVTNYLVPGKTTIVDFFSEYCPPCRAIAPKLEKLHKTRDDIAVVKVDINRPGVKGIDWQSPVAQQYQLHSIPHFQIYSPDGKLKAEGDAAYDQVSSWVE